MDPVWAPGGGGIVRVPARAPVGTADVERGRAGSVSRLHRRILDLRGIDPVASPPLDGTDRVDRGAALRRMVERAGCAAGRPVFPGIVLLPGPPFVARPRYAGRDAARRSGVDVRDMDR